MVGSRSAALAPVCSLFISVPCVEVAMNDRQISALDGIVNLGSIGAAGGGGALGLAFAAMDDLGGVFAGRLAVLGGVAFFRAEGVTPAVRPTGDAGAAVDSAVDPGDGDGPLLAAFGTLDAVRSSSIFQRAGPTRQPVPRVIIAPLPGRLNVRRYCRHGVSGDG